MMKIYMDFVPGLSEAGCSFCESTILPSLQSWGYFVTDSRYAAADRISKVLSVVAGSPKAENVTGGSESHGGRKRRDRLVACDAMLVPLETTDIEAGTASQIGFAAAMEKPVLIYCFASIELGTTINKQVAFFVQDSGGTIVNSIDSVQRFLDDLGKRQPLERFDGHPRRMNPNERSIPFFPVVPSGNSIVAHVPREKDRLSVERDDTIA